MTKDCFFKQLTTFFSSKGFSCKSKHYYKEAASDVAIVFGIQTSRYGEYCYLEYGYCFNSINKNFPYPKFNQLNLNCGRVMTDMGNAIVFGKIDENTMDAIEETIDGIISEMDKLVRIGKDGMIKYYLSGEFNQSWYILGDQTADYFGLPKETFQYHFVKDL